MHSDTREGRRELAERLRDMAEASRAVASKNELENGLADDLAALLEAANLLDQAPEEGLRGALEQIAIASAAAASGQRVGTGTWREINRKTRSLLNSPDLPIGRGR